MKFIKLSLLRAVSKSIVFIMGIIIFIPGCERFKSGEEIYLYGVKEVLDTEDLNENN